MPVRLSHIHKSHQPGDLAAFSAEETRAIVLAGHGTIEDPLGAAEAELFDLQRAALADVGTARSRELDPALRPAPGAGAPVADLLRTTPLFERPTATPMPGTAPALRGDSLALDHARLGDPYLAALRRVLADGAPIDADARSDDALARRVIRLDLDSDERARLDRLRNGDAAAGLEAMDRPALDELALLLFRAHFGGADDDALRRGLRALLAEPVPAAPPGDEPREIDAAAGGEGAGHDAEESAGAGWGDTGGRPGGSDEPGAPAGAAEAGA